MNLIVEERDDGSVVVRNCDVEAVVKQDDEIQHELRAIRNEFGSLADDFDRGLHEHHRDDAPKIEATHEESKEGSNGA